MKSHNQRQASVPVISIDNVVPFPDTEILIHISDEQTVELILKSINNQTPVAICSRESFFDYSKDPVGCLAYPSLDGKGPQNTYYILLKMGPRVYLKDLVQEIPHPEYTYIASDDQELNIEHTFSGHVLRNIKNMLLDWSEQNIADSIERNYFNSKLTSLSAITNYGCMYLLSSQELKQSLLENESLFKRTYLLNLLLKDVATNEMNNQVVKALLDYDTIEQTSQFAH